MITAFSKPKLVSLLLTVTLILPWMAISPVLGAGSYPYTTVSTEVSGGVDYLRGQQVATGAIQDFATSAWAVMAIVSAGEAPHSWRVDSGPTIIDYLSENAGSASSTNDYSRMILAAVAAAENPTSFGGRDFVSLLESSYDGTQIGDNSLLNDDVWGVMALVAAGVDPSTSDVIQNSVSFILANQNADGGWSWGVEQASDVDSTAATIMALIASGQPPGSTPVADALAYIKSTQMENGGFESWGATNSATNSWAINSIVAAGQDPTGAEWINDQGNGPVDDLLTFRNEDGSFNWTVETPSNKELMTSEAILALLGTPYPVVVLGTPAMQKGVTIDVRVEGQTSTVWSGTVIVDESTIIDDQGVLHHIDQPTALGALDEASQGGGFSYVVKNTSFGLYVESINGENPAGTAGWTYRADYLSPMVGVADFVLDQTSPPPPPHQEILFAYAQWGDAPLRVEVDNTAPGVGETFVVTVTEYDDDTGTWSMAANATVYADKIYETSEDGTVAITIDSDLTVEVYSEKEGCIRSNRIVATVGEGSVQPGDSENISLTADIVPAISFSVTPNGIGFGTLGPRDVSDPTSLTITNLGAWNLNITAVVTDTANDLYVNGLNLDGVKWDEFSTTVLRDAANECVAILSVPETYRDTGLQSGTLILWAQEAS